MSEEMDKEQEETLQEESEQSDADTLEEEVQDSELSPQEFNADELMATQFAQEEHGFSEEEEKEKFSLLLDIPLEVTVEIGTTQMKIEEVLKLNPNSIIELDRYINEPVDLKVNGRLVAKGELYTVKNNFGIRITHIVTPEDRLKIIQG